MAISSSAAGGDLGAEEIATAPLRDALGYPDFVSSARTGATASGIGLRAKTARAIAVVLKLRRAAPRAMFIGSTVVATHVPLAPAPLGFNQGQGGAPDLASLLEVML